MYELTVESHFAAAHNLRHYKGLCEHLHGHNYKVQAAVCTGILDKTGLAIDFTLFRKYLKEVLAGLDHKYLNDIPYFKDKNPSTEIIAQYIYKNFKKKLGKYKHIALKKITCWEEHYASASYYE